MDWCFIFAYRLKVKNTFVKTIVAPRDMARIRASLDPMRSIYYTFQGSVEYHLPEVRPERLFTIKGMSATRCVRLDNGCYGYTMREIMLYCDPSSGKILDAWQNPWSGENVPVVHIANDPVQGTFFPSTPAMWSDRNLTISISAFPDAINPLFGDDRFAPYGGSRPRYRSEENFHIVCPNFVMDSVEPVTDMVMFWRRRVTWLPWMKMGLLERESPELEQGELFYSAVAKPAEYQECLLEVRERVEQQLPDFLEAPQWLVGKPPFWGKNSWEYFRDNFDRYLAGDLFPVSRVDLVV